LPAGPPRADEDGTVQVPHPLGVEPPGALGSQRRLGRGVVHDDRVGRERGAERRDHLLDHGIVPEHQVDALDAPNRVGRRRGHPDAESLERLGLLPGAVPRHDPVTPPRRGLRQGAAEETGAKKRRFAHPRLSSGSRRRSVDLIMDSSA
jgi:hypothetical protein